MLFFLAFFTIYLTMHVFAWFRFCSQLSISPRPAKFGYIVCVFLAITPVLAHLLPISWPQGIVYLFWQLTFTWLAVIFYLFIFQLLIFLSQTVLWPFIKPKWPVISPWVAYSTVLVCFAIVGYGFKEASRLPKVVDYEFESSKISKDFKLVFLSDLHLGVQKSSARLGKIIELIENQEADLIIFGGDVVNDHLEWLEDEAMQLKSLNAPMGKFGVLGNHEFYPGIDKSMELFRQSEIIILDNQKEDLDDVNLTLAGVSDPTPFRTPREHQEEVTRRLLTDIDETRFNLLVSHRPWGFEHAARAGIDLHIAGHTHNGQLFPFRYFVQLQFEHIYGLYEQCESWLIVSSGAGSWGPPVRVLSPPEILVVRINLVSDREQ
jgi:uncharacterized protein